MTIDVSAFGLSVNIKASITFPQGITVNAFPDDADPIDNPSMQIKDKAMGLNGDLITWTKGVPVPFTINVLPGTEDDANLQVLARANRAAKGRRAVLDVITLAVTYPSGRIVRYLRGALTDAQIGDGVASAGRLKSKAYQFAFEDVQ